MKLLSEKWRDQTRGAKGTRDLKGIKMGVELRGDTSPSQLGGLGQWSNNIIIYKGL